MPDLQLVNLTMAAAGQRILPPAFPTEAEQRDAHRRTVVFEFAELAANDDDLWSEMADALIDSRGLDGEPVDHLLKRLRTYAARRP